jgi:hypothetical protein
VLHGSTASSESIESISRSEPPRQFTELCDLQFRGKLPEAKRSTPRPATRAEPSTAKPKPTATANAVVSRPKKQAKETIAKGMVRVASGELVSKKQFRREMAKEASRLMFLHEVMAIDVRYQQNFVGPLMDAMAENRTA